MRTSRTLTRSASRRTSATRAEKPASSVRPIIVGTDIQYPAGTSLRNKLIGYNFGAYGTVQLPGDVTQAIADGANIVRVVGNFRWDGGYGTPGTDSRDDTSFAHFAKGNWETMKAIVKALTDAGIWTIVTFDSNYRINANSGTGIGTTGDNIYTNGATLGLVREIWKMAAKEFASYPYIFAYELTSEPMVDASFDNTWNATLKSVYRTLIADIRTVDANTPFVLGGRNGYDRDQMANAILSERTDCIYTWDYLSNGLTNIAGIPGSFDVVCAAGASANAPIFCNQLGSRSDGDPNDYAMRAGYMVAKARGVISTWWQVKDKSTSTAAYGLRYDNGAGGYADKARVAVFQSLASMTLASLESAAQAAATAAGAVLFYVKPDFSNVFQDSAGTTPVTAKGQPVGLMNPVVGSGLTLSQATTTARPSVSTPTYTIDQRPMLTFDATSTFLSGSGVYYASGDDQTVIAAGIPANTASIQTMVDVGNTTATDHYPRLGCSAGKVALALWEGDDAVAQNCTGTTATGNFPMVLSAVKAGANKQLFVNGVQEGATNTGAVGTIATMSRLRVGGKTTAADFNGGIALVCVCKGGMTSTQRQAIERFAAYLVGAGYQL